MDLLLSVEKIMWLTHNLIETYVMKITDLEFYLTILFPLWVWWFYIDILFKSLAGHNLVQDDWHESGAVPHQVWNH